MGNRRMKELTGAEIIIHEKEAGSLVQQSPYMMQMFHAEPISSGRYYSKRR